MNKQLFVWLKPGYGHIWKRLKPLVWTCYSQQFLFKIYNTVEKCSLYKKSNHGLYRQRYNPQQCRIIFWYWWTTTVSMIENPFQSYFLTNDETMKMGFVILCPVRSLVFLIFFLLLCLCSDHHQWRHHVDPVRFWAAVLSHQGGELLQPVSEMRFQVLGFSFPMLGNKFGSSLCTRKSN